MSQKPGAVIAPPMTKEKALIPQHPTLAGSAKGAPVEAHVAKLAYELWSERGCPDGSPEHDWFQAETLLRTGKTTIASSA